MPIAIASRFNGPLESGNGGYSSGIVAARLGGGPATVSLRRPIPLTHPSTSSLRATRCGSSTARR